MPEEPASSRLHAFLVMSFDGKPRALWRANIAERLVWPDGRTFKRVDSNGFTGFQDWLRSADGSIVGVRFYAFDSFREALPKPGGSWFFLDEETDALVIRFDPDAAVDEARSGDQAFGDNYFFICKAGGLLVTFGTCWLNEVELQSLALSLASWM